MAYRLNLAPGALTDRVQAEISREFTPEAASTVVSTLEAAAFPLIPRHSRDEERIQLAILHLANGRAEEVTRWTRDAAIDWRDVLITAGLGDKDWRSVLAGRHGG